MELDPILGSITKDYDWSIINQPGGTWCQARARACHLASTYVSSNKSTSKGFRQNVGAPTGSLDKIIYLFPKYVKYLAII
jgi:hypothetical protein